MKHCLEVKDLSIYYGYYHGSTPDRADIHEVGIVAVHNVSFTLHEGNSLGIIGESGSGKTSLALAVMGLLDKSARVKGQVLYDTVDLQQLSERQRKKYRWHKIAMVFQNSLDVLNPVLTVHEQIIEAIRRHEGLSRPAARARTDELLCTVGLDPAWGKSYPHELSGGMRQRVLIAMALACDPQFLIVDEPTASLDAMTKGEIVDLLHRLQKERQFGLIVISHDMSVVAGLTSQLAVMYQGYFLETGFTKDVLKNPMHPYTRGLLNSSPSINPYRDLWGIPVELRPNTTSGCPFYARCDQAIAICKQKRPALQYVSVEREVACNRGGIVTLLVGRGIYKTYKQGKRRVQACINCNLAVRAGEIVVLIGQSGSGKTTLASILSGLLPADAGEVLFEDERLIGNAATSRYGGIQMVFQDPFSATNPYFTTQQVVAEPLDILGIQSKTERKAAVRQALRDVQLPDSEEFLQRPCYELSGGQRQRLALARSLVLKPKLLIADEISSMLDPSTEANILRLLKGLQNSQGFAMLYITHDLNLARKIADKVYVMYQGQIVDVGPPGEIFCNPTNAYTKRLVESDSRLISLQ